MDSLYVPGSGGGRHMGLADLKGGTEIKTLLGTSSRNTLSRHLHDAARKADCVRVVFDNTENTGMGDEALAVTLLGIDRFLGGSLYMLGRDGSLTRLG